MSENFPLPPASATSRLSGIQRQFIASGVGQGFGSNRILAGLRQAGIGLNRQSGLAAIRELAGVVGQGGPLNQTVPSFKPSESLFKPTSYFQEQPYRVWARYSAVNAVTGQRQTYHAVIALDEIVTRSEIDALLLDQLSHASRSGQFALDVSDIEYTTLERRV